MTPPTRSPTLEELSDVPVALRAPELMPWTDARPAGVTEDGEILGQRPAEEVASSRGVLVEPATFRGQPRPAAPQP